MKNLTATEINERMRVFEKDLLLVEEKCYSDYMRKRLGEIDQNNMLEVYKLLVESLAIRYVVGNSLIWNQF